MTGARSPIYKAEPAGNLLVEALDTMTLIYHRRSGITHIVAEPVPDILAALGTDALTAELLAQRLAIDFDFGSDLAEATAIIASRLDEMAELGLLERLSA